MKFLGKHTILEFYDCPDSLLSNPEEIQQHLEAAALAMGATIIESRFHHFSPLGVSGVIIIAESHLTIHTWPEYQYAAVDVFTCGDIDVEKGVALLEKLLQAGKTEVQLLERGRLAAFNKIST